MEVKLFYLSVMAEYFKAHAAPVLTFCLMYAKRIVQFQFYNKQPILMPFDSISVTGMVECLRKKSI